MKGIKKCPLFLLLAVSGVAFSLLGMIGRKTVYSEYEFELVKTPYLSLVMEGISKGIKPWEVFGAADFVGEDKEETQQTMASSGQPGQSIEEFKDEIEADREEEVQTAPEDAVSETGVVEEQTVDSVAAQEQTVAAGEAADVRYDFQTVTEDYFDDAVFIGDSRTVGLFEYGGIEERADFFAKISMTIYDVFTEPVARDEETGRKITVEEALSKKQYGKVYLMLGINELGTGNTEYFMKEYEKVVTRLRELQPNAVIFVQGIMRVTGTKNEADPIFNNTNINERNAEIAKLADNKDIFYIDVNEVVCDAEGNLNAEYTIDEIHLKAKYYEIWKQFLLEHGIVR